MYRNVHAIGDSHVLHMGGLFYTHHICDARGQGATAHNLIEDESTTDSKRKLNAILDSLDPAKDIVLLSFGEVDCRLHIADELGVVDTVSRYTQAIEGVLERGFVTIVTAVIGAVPQDNEWRRPNGPSLEKRAELVVEFNRLLHKWCDENCARFLKLDTSYLGILKPELCDDGVHLNAQGEALYAEWAKTANLGPQAKNVVWSLGAMSTHSKMVADVLGWPLFLECPVGNDVDTVYIIGMYDVPDYDFTIENTKRARRRIIHWCGSDVQALSRPEMMPEAIHLCETEGLQRELREKGVEATVCMFPSKHHTPVAPLPDEPVVTFYAGTDAEKYGAAMLRFVMDAIPEVKYHVYGLGDYDASQMPEVIAQSRVHVRFTRHDGSALSVREYLEGGRRVVCTADLPYAKVVSLNDPVGIVRAVRAALKADKPDEAASAHYAEVNAPERFIREFEEATR